MTFRQLPFIALFALLAACGGKSTQETAEAPPPPAPASVVPHPRQMAYQEKEIVGFAHFTVNTYTDKEWGDGTESPQIFNPTEFDAKQWVQAMKDGGIQQVILTAKHHDGFCLWPTATTDHSVKSSPWRNGEGDVVKEVAEACREFGLKFGTYLSPWDQNVPVYGTPEYNDFYKEQLRELMGNYGEISEVWFDGAKGPDAKDMVYDFAGFRKIVREMQPDAVMFSDAGPDVRWVGNEHGFAGETCWSTFDTTKVEIGTANTKYLNEGEKGGPHWVVPECDVSIRPGWFYHPTEDDKVKTVAALVDIYYKSVGRNGTLLLNIPPDRRGLLHETDVARLKAFKATIDETFAQNLAEGATAEADQVRGDHPDYAPANLFDGDQETYWATADGTQQATINIKLPEARTFDRAMLREPVQLGQRVAGFKLEAKVGDGWQTLHEGTTIGYKRLLRFEEVTSRQLRLTITDAAEACLLLSEFGLYKASPREQEGA